MRCWEEDHGSGDVHQLQHRRGHHQMVEIFQTFFPRENNNAGDVAEWSNNTNKYLIQSRIIFIVLETLYSILYTATRIIFFIQKFFLKILLNKRGITLLHGSINTWAVLPSSTPTSIRLQLQLELRTRLKSKVFSLEKLYPLSQVPRKIEKSLLLPWN